MARFGILALPLAAAFADFDVGGGGVANIFRKASSKPKPCVVMGCVFTLLGQNLPLFFGHRKPKVKSRKATQYDAIQGMLAARNWWPVAWGSVAFI